MGVMKQWMLLMAVLFWVSVGIASCKKNDGGTRRTGKLVVIGACAHYIVQLMDVTAADSSVVTQSWTNPNTDSRYTSVFGVSDICTFAAAEVQVGSVFTFTLNGPVPDVVCNTCDIFPFPMPAAVNSVTNIQLVTNQ
jgi:hypothetical protein